MQPTTDATRIVSFVTEAIRVQRILNHIGEPSELIADCSGTGAAGAGRRARFAPGLESDLPART